MNRLQVRLVAGVTTLGLAAALGIAPAAAADAPTLSFNARTAGDAVLGLIPGTIRVTASVPGKVAFKAAGVDIPGCTAIDTSAAAPYVALCPKWEATKAGPHELTAILTPNDTSLPQASAKPITVSVGTPINEGDQYNPVTVYVDTVTGTATGKGQLSLAPFLNNASCVVLSQFVRGMTIVFRVYANDHDRGGIPLTHETAAVSITVAGVEKPIELSYGNHSGAAFWAAAMATGEPGSGRYSTLGTIKYSINVTLIEQPAVTRTVKAVRYVALKKNGKTVKVSGKVVYVPQTYTKTEIVKPAVTGKTYVYTPDRWPTTSLLTLNAVPLGS